MFDAQGRVWMAATGHPKANPDFCKDGKLHPSAKVQPLPQTNRRVTVYDPKTGKYAALQTCFQTHHLQFGYDANETLWTSGGGQVIGWINTKMYDATGDIVKSQPVCLKTGRLQATQPTVPNGEPVKVPSASTSTFRKLILRSRFHSSCHSRLRPITLKLNLISPAQNDLSSCT